MSGRSDRRDTGMIPDAAVVKSAGAWREDDPVEVRYPLPDSAERDRSSWPWLPGTILQVCGPDEWQADPGIAEQVTTTLASLPQRQREALRLRYLDRLGWTAAADRMGLTVKGIQSAAYVALARLR